MVNGKRGRSKTPRYGTNAVAKPRGRSAADVAISMLPPNLRNAARLARSASSLASSVYKRYNSGSYVRDKSLPFGTQSRRKSNMSGKGAADSKSAGKFGGMSRKGRKPKGWQSSSGHSVTLETGDVLTNNDIVYVGHITAPRERVYNLAWQCIIKLLVTKMNKKINAFDDAISQNGFNDGDVFQYRFRENAETTTVSQTAFTVAAGNTWSTAAVYFAGLIAANTNASEWLPVDFSYVPVTAGVGIYIQSIALDCLMLHFEIKSSLKIQNRTFGANGDTSDEVDNVPLYGKSVGGKGTGVQARFPASSNPANIVGSVDTGLIKQVNLGAGNKEPLSGFFWPKSSVEGKAHLDPGQIKTSVLNTKRNISLRYLTKLFQYVPFGAAAPPLTSFGQYRFFQLEKMLDVGTTVSIKVAFEINLFMGCYATTKMNYATTPGYIKV